MRLIDADLIEPSEIVIPLIDGGYEYVEVVYVDDLRDIPTADVVERKNMTRLERELQGMTSEEQIDFILWLLNDFSMQYTSSRQAMINWNTERGEDVE